MFNPIYCLFEYSSHGKYTLQISPRSDINPEHLEYFKFIGRVVGVAIFHQRFLDAFFVSAVYKQVLGMSISPEDLESIDPELWKGVAWMQENDVTGLMYHFSVDDERFGVICEQDLKPEGRHIEVTNENKLEYIDLLTRWNITKQSNINVYKFISNRCWQETPAPGYPGAGLHGRLFGERRSLSFVRRDRGMSGGGWGPCACPGGGSALSTRTSTRPPPPPHRPLSLHTPSLLSQKPAPES